VNRRYQNRLQKAHKARKQLNAFVLYALFWLVPTNRYGLSGVFVCSVSGFFSFGGASFCCCC